MSEGREELLLGLFGVRGTVRQHLYEQRKGGPACRPMQTLNTRSLHSTDHRFAMICSGRDDRVGEILRGLASAQDDGGFGVSAGWGVTWVGWDLGHIWR